MKSYLTGNPEIRLALNDDLLIGKGGRSISHHQDAAREYLEAYKLLPENPLINLCVGMFSN